MKKALLTFFLLFLLYISGLTQFRSFTYQGEYKFKTKKDFDTTYVFAFPEKWIEPSDKWLLSPSQVSISFSLSAKSFGFVTPKGLMGGIVNGTYERTKAGHKFKVQMQVDRSPANNIAGDILFNTDKNDNWVSLSYYFPGYTNGLFILAEKKIDSSQQKIEKYKTAYVNNIKRCIEIANEVLKTEDTLKINKLKKEAMQSQGKARDALLYLEDPALNFPHENIQSILKVNPIFFGPGVFGDKRILSMTALEYKKKVQEQIENINSALPVIEKFKSL